MTMKVRALLGIAVALITMSLSGCGHYTCGATFGNGSCTSSGGGITQGGGGTGSALIAYGYFTPFSVNGQPSTGIAKFTLDQSAGTFLDISSFLPPLVPPFPTGMTIVGKSFMYIPSADGTLYGFVIDSSGNFTNVTGSPYSVAGGDSVAASASGNLLFVGDSAGQQVSVFTVNADGSLTSVGNPFPTSGVSPSVMATDGQSKFLYATAGRFSANVAEFAIGTGGALTLVAGSPFSSNVSAIVGEPSGKFMLGVSYLAGDNHVQVFSIGSTGSLTLLASNTTSFVPRNLAVHPNGKWVYTFSEDPVLTELDPVEGFDLDTTSGTLTEMSGSPFTDLIANGGAIEQSGQFVFGLGHTVISGFAEPTVSPYAIDQNAGTLSTWPAGQISSQGFVGIDSAVFAATDAP
jgi:6-phosphogluconolactonase (cycloisomerase 2 family)